MRLPPSICPSPPSRTPPPSPSSLPPLPSSPSRRLLLQLFTLATSALLSPGAPAVASYTVVPTGTIASKSARLSEVEQLYAKTPDDPYVFGEKAQLEYDLMALEKNKAYASDVRNAVESGGVFLQGLSLGVDDMEESLRFWTGGLGALVVDSRIVGGANVSRVSFGSSSLGAEDGAKFTLQLEEGGSKVEAVEYLQLAMPVFRLSQAIAFGGEIISAYGWTELIAPGGLKLRVRIDEKRRDPFEFIALRTSSLEKSKTYFQNLGMKVQSVKGGKRINTKASILTSNSIFENEDATEPEREVGATLLSIDDPSLCTGCLLLPPKGKQRSTPPSPPTALRFVGGTALSGNAPTATSVSPDGLATIFWSPAEFEASVKTA